MQETGKPDKGDDAAKETAPKSEKKKGKRVETED